MVLMGCGGTKAILLTGEERIDFKKYKTVCLRVTDEVKNNYSVGAIPLLDGMLQAELISMGFKIAQENADLWVNVAITRADPGNKALRLIVGFGAGMVRVDYKAQFKDRNNNILSEFSGWEGDAWKEQIHWDSDRLRLEIIRVAVSKIARFIKEGKTLE
jgi:hypothetical protein